MVLAFTSQFEPRATVTRFPVEKKPKPTLQRSTGFVCEHLKQFLQTGLATREVAYMGFKVRVKINFDSYEFLGISQNLLDKEDDQTVIKVVTNNSFKVKQIFINVGSIFDYEYDPSYEYVRFMDPVQKTSLPEGDYQYREKMEKRSFFTQDLINGALMILGDQEKIPVGVKFYQDKDHYQRILGLPDYEKEWDVAYFGPNMVRVYEIEPRTDTLILTARDDF